MLPIREAIRRIRVAIHDEEQRINYSDTEILDAINSGLRVIRRTIAEIQPEILVTTVMGTLAATQSEIELPSRPLQIIDLTAGKYKLLETNMQHVRKKVASEHPKYFYRVGLQSLKVYPKPLVETEYAVRYVEDIGELGIEDTAPILNEFDDFLIEYAAYRLALTDEFDMTQEQQIIANIHQQIASILAPPPAGTVVHGYW